MEKEKPEATHEYYSDTSVPAGAPEVAKNISPEVTTDMMTEHELSDEVKLMAEDIADNPKTMADCFDQLQEVTITKEEKEAFLDCVADNSQYLQTVSLYNGKVNALLGIKTSKEQQAILHAVDLEAAKEDADDWKDKIRIYTLFFQLRMLNGVVIPEYEGELFYTYDKDGKVVKPAWVARAEALLHDKSRAIQLGIYKAIVRFEITYEYLVSKAADQNFWQAGDSTFLA